MLDDWYDDISDGPVAAEVKIENREIPVEAAWLVVGPPNYAPGIVGWRTLHDLLTDAFIEAGWMEMPARVSFSEHILPVLQRLCNLQWVNAGFAAMFGKGCPLDFNDPRLIEKLARPPDPATDDPDTIIDPYRNLRQAIFRAFRSDGTKVNDPTALPWICGDAFYGSWPDSPRNNLALSRVREALLRRWVEGDFFDDTKSASVPPGDITCVRLADQPAMLDKAALHFCVADAFHPGCEVTWTLRHTSLFEKPFRIRYRAVDDPEPDYGDELGPEQVMQPGWPALRAGSGRSHPLDGGTVADRYGVLPFGFQSGV